VDPWFVGILTGGVVRSVVEAVGPLVVAERACLQAGCRSPLVVGVRMVEEVVVFPAVGALIAVVDLLLVGIRVVQVPELVVVQVVRIPGTRDFLSVEAPIEVVDLLLVVVQIVRIPGTPPFVEKNSWCGGVPVVLLYR